MAEGGSEAGLGLHALLQAAHVEVRADEREGLPAPRRQGLVLRRLPVQEAVQDGEWSVGEVDVREAVGEVECVGVAREVVVAVVVKVASEALTWSPQIQQYKAIKYDVSPLSPISRHRLNMVRKKVWRPMQTTNQHQPP